MRNLIALAAMAVAAASAQKGTILDLFPGTHVEALAQIKSPDRRSTAIVTAGRRHGWMVPFEGDQTLERWARLRVIKDGYTIYDSGFEPLHTAETDPNRALDLVWSPDSTHIAYRHIDKLRTIGLDGKATKYGLLPEDSIVSSFRWIDNESLMVVSKKRLHPDDLNPHIFSLGVLDPPKDIRVSRLHLTKGQMERYQQPVQKPTFLFHSLRFYMDEISPNSDRVAFSDGVHLCVYDDTAGKLIAQVTIPQKPGAPYTPSDAVKWAIKSGDTEWAASTQRGEMEWYARPIQLDGIWWQTNNRLVVGLEVLGRKDRMAFYTFDLPSRKLTDVTKALLPLWEVPLVSPDDFYPYGWSRPNWYRAGLQ